MTGYASTTIALMETITALTHENEQLRKQMATARALVEMWNPTPQPAP